MDSDRRAKALKRLVVMMRIANDERSPEGERGAARAAADRIAERYKFPASELRAEIERDLCAQDPARARRRASEPFGRPPPQQKPDFAGATGAMFRDATGNVFVARPGDAFAAMGMSMPRNGRSSRGRIEFTEEGATIIFE